MSKQKKLSVIALILMIFTTVFGFNNITRSFWLMGYAAIPWYILSALLFFLPYAFINAEFGAAYKESKGGIYTWMSESVGPKFGFIGTFMWYASYVIWLVALAITIWVSFSYAIFGAETTSTWQPFGMSTNLFFAILGTAWIAFLTWVGTKGISGVKKIASIGGSATALLNIVLLGSAVILFILQGGQLREPISPQAIVNSPNPSYQNLVAMAGFVVMAIFAYGGIESVSGYVDDTENAEVNFPKGLKIAAIIISVGYSLGILAVGVFSNWQADLSDPKMVHMGNASYEIMKNLGVRLGEAFGMSNPELLGQGIVRYMAISLFLALTGAYLSLLFAPLKQLIEGTPKELWPGKLAEMKDGVPQKALIAQAILVIAIVWVVSLAGGKGGTLFTNITMMMNTSMSLPYVFVSYAYWFFKKNDAIAKPFEMFKTKRMALFAVISSIAVVVIGNILQIADPIVNYYRNIPSFKTDAARLAARSEAYTGAAFMIVAPILFTLIAFAIYKNGEKKAAQNNKSLDLN